VKEAVVGLLITEHCIIKTPEKKVLGQIRRRQEPTKNGRDFWQVRTAEVEEWFGEYPTREAAEARLREAGE
jgi:hypothetical protein